MSKCTKIDGIPDRDSFPIVAENETALGVAPPKMMIQEYTVGHKRDPSERNQGRECGPSRVPTQSPW
jgi:hypothetical protein